MQINRLFEIVYILLNKEQITARELSERFEVSTRTIYRDIETLCEAGIPIYTNKGKGGGISLLENFVLNKSVFSAEEKKEMIAALQGLRAASYAESKGLLSKVEALFGSEQDDWIEINFASWNAVEKQKFEKLKTAVLQKLVIRFEYYNTKREKLEREVEPLQLSFQDKTWYLRGYCRMKKGIRLFKLTRIKKLIVLNEQFERKLPKTSQEEFFNNLTRQSIMLKLWIDGCNAYRVYDEFEEEQISQNKDGSFIVEVSYPEDDWLYGYLLSYGPFIKVLEPLEIKEKLIQRLEETLRLYGRDGGIS